MSRVLVILCRAFPHIVVDATQFKHAAVLFGFGGWHSWLILLDRHVFVYLLKIHLPLVRPVIRWRPLPPWLCRLPYIVCDTAPLVLHYVVLRQSTGRYHASVLLQVAQ